MPADSKVRGKSMISDRGQTVVPKEVREALGVKPGTSLRWTVENGVATVRPMPDDPIEAAIGALEHLGLSTADLLAERRADNEREEAETKEQLQRWQSSR
jgi:AbrB family looped-hinge helix DNA binding protein